MKKQYLVLLLTFVLWGSIYTVNKFAFDYIPPITMLVFRYVFALLLMVPLALHKGLVKIQKGHWKYFIIGGTLGYGVACILVNIATKFMDSSISSLINSMNPVAISLMAVLILREKISKFTVIGIVCAVAGAIIVLGGAGGNVTVIGMAAAIGGVIFWALMSVYVRKLGPYYSSEQTTMILMIIALPVVCVASAFELFVSKEPITFNFQGIAAALYIAFIASGLGNLLWNASLKKIEASICSAFYPIQPLASAILGVIILGEEITWKLVIGGVVIAAGVVISIIGEKIWKKVAHVSRG